MLKNMICYCASDQTNCEMKYGSNLFEADDITKIYEKVFLQALVVYYRVLFNECISLVISPDITI